MNQSHSHVTENSSNSCPADNRFSLRPVSQIEVLNTLTYLSTKKTMGTDDFDPYLLQLSAHIIASLLAYICNLIHLW